MVCKKKLDARILEKKLLVEKTIDKRFLALLVELSEFSNELRCFKYWSNRMTYNISQKN
ncbi:dUTP diphosphatase [Spiroplasma endosymbiont of Clivina fossor]|uniref:dUTP diphosphatase n=1 Tax=Spiroplasma endosymbiont of Clivina fossor TaxID=3066282 RepID=UPI003CC7A26E